jgi:hypothetical protein
MFELKKLSPSGIDAALKKAERYRVLNEPWEAESICRDVLVIEPAHQPALVTLLLALTDQFTEGGNDRLSAARAVLPDLKDAYARAYYAGIICERWGKRVLETRSPGAGPVVYQWLREAMEHYEEAERVRPTGEDDAILRWNTCARLIERHPNVRPAPQSDRVEMPLE